MVRAGAAGETAAQLDAALGLEKDPVQALAALARAAILVPRERKETQAPDLRVANALWVAEDAPLLPAFTAVLKDEFAAPARPVDFTATARARELVNDWVAEQTRNRIRDLLPAGLPTRDTRLVLVNCLYLDAPWESPFFAPATKPRPFTLAGGEQVEVPTMAQTEKFGYAESECLQVVVLPFAGGELSMLVAVPRGDTSLADAAAELRAKWSGLASPPYRPVQLELPRFTLTSEIDLKAALTAMGVRDLFDPERADLSGMADDTDLYAAAALQKTFVKADERGAEAAAATGVVIAPTAAAPDPQEPVTVRVDRPFLFAIRHARAGSLFLGRIVDPR
jgi:serpin B